jgi:DNA-binding transcriptional regulator GbsR (MarR family)
MTSQTGNAFMRHFGEMSGSWGFSRTVGQIFALLYISSDPLCADDIMKEVGCSRSNVSIGLKELQGWRLVRLHHVAGDRRDYFSTPEDCWDIFRLVAAERKRREIDPTLVVLRELMLAQAASEEERRAQAKLREMYALMEHMTRWFETIQRLDHDALLRLIKLAPEMKQLLERDLALL